MKTLIGKILLSICILLSASCNKNDYIEDFKKNTPEQMTIEANGGPATIHFSASNWSVINVAAASVSSTYNYYESFDLNGNRLNSGTEKFMLDGLGKTIVHIYPDYTLTLVREYPNSLTIYAENHTDSLETTPLTVGNEYDTKDITILVHPTKK